MTRFAAVSIPAASQYSPDELLGRMREHFTDLHFRWSPYVPSGPVILPPGAGLELTGAAIRLLALLERAALELAETPALRHAALGLDERLLPLYQSRSFEERYATALARPDVILTADGWRFIEFNVGGAVGGQTYVHLFNSFWREVLKPSWTSSLVLDSPLDLRADLFEQVARDLGVEPSVAVIGCAEDINLTNLRYYDIEVDHLRSRGIRSDYYESADYADASDRTGQVMPLGVQRFMVQDWIDSGRSIDSIVAVRASGTALLAPQSSEHAGNKRLLAALSEGTVRMSDEERHFVRRYVPWTREISDRAVVHRGVERPLVQLLLEQKDHFVIKRSDSGSGHDVHLGWAMPQNQWHQVIRTALAVGTWTAQERVESVRLPVRVIDAETLREVEIEAPAIFGPLIFGGRAGGCFVRYDTAATEEMMTLRLGSVLMNSACWPNR